MCCPASLVRSLLGKCTRHIHSNNKLGLGTAVPVYKLAEIFDPKSKIVYVDATNGTDSLAVLAIMTVLTRNFSQAQKDAVIRLESEAEIATACPHSFQIVSNCYGAIVFKSANLKNPIQYTLRADMGRLDVDVEHHTSDAETITLPLQWAVDSAIIELISGISVDPPNQQPFTKMTNEATKQKTRRSFLNSIRELVVLAFFAGQMGVVYHMAGEVMFERAATLTSHLTAMGCMASARILSWHMCISGAYLPSWIAAALLWHWSIFTHTPLGLFIGIHLITGFSLASWALLVAQPFYKSPQLAAIACSVLAVVLVFWPCCLEGRGLRLWSMLLFVRFGQPGFYVFALKSLAAWELADHPVELFKPDTDGFMFGPPLIAAGTHPARTQFRKAHRPGSVWANAAVSIRGLHKTYSNGVFKKRTHTAIEHLDLDIPPSGIHVFCGRNGSGKTTLLRIIAGLESASEGEVVYADGMPRPAAGDLGIVPQKNVLWNELTCAQHLTLWGALKRPSGAPSEEVGELLQECGLLAKKHAAAGSLSGGQKRRLQLAIGLVGGVSWCGPDLATRDMAGSGSSPVRRTIIYTTHFLDEADLLADHVSIMTAPGRIVARGSPVMLKTGHSQGYVVTCTFDNSTQQSLDARRHQPVLIAVRRHAPSAVMLNGGQEDDGISLRTHNPRVVSQVLRLLERDKRRLGLRSFDIRATTLSDVFLKLMGEDGSDGLEKAYPPLPLTGTGLLSPGRPYDARSETAEAERHLRGARPHVESDEPLVLAIPEAQYRSSHLASRESHATSSDWYAMDRPISMAPHEAQRLYSSKHRDSSIDLTEGRPTSIFLQAWVLWKKRMLVARRGWVVPFLAAVLAIGGACIPLFFIHNRQNRCIRNEHEDMRYSLFLPISPFAWNDTGRTYVAPPGALSSLQYPIPGAYPLADMNAFDTAIEATRAIGYGPKINGEIQPMPSITPRGIGPAIKWIAFFGSSMAAWPAMAALYVTKERASHVQAMQLSNGSRRLGCGTIGHLLYEIPIILAISGAITGIFASTGQFFNLELLFLVIVLYGIDATLLSFVASLFIRSPIAAFAIIAGYQCITFLGYLAGVFYTLATIFSYTAGNILTTMHYLIAIISPVASVVRAGFIGTNIFYTLCSDHGNLDSGSDLGAMDRFGAPIAYTVIHSAFLLAFLIWYDSGMPWYLVNGTSPQRTTQNLDGMPRMTYKAARVARSFDSLRISHASKTYGKTQALEDVTFGLSSGIFGLLGSNGGGKTTLFNLIQGHLLPDHTDPACNVFIDGRSIITSRNKARTRLGVCPQATALESVLTVREHLEMYARCKGLSGEDLDRNVECIMAATQLLPHSHKYANKLSGGNQRKLSLAIALLGSPAVVLIDEFSTGVDPSTKRDLWDTLRRVSMGKAVLLTTHAMEEVTALADRIGIISQRLLGAYWNHRRSRQPIPLYEVHFSSSTPGEEARMREVMRDFPSNWRASDDLTARYEVELEPGQSLADIFEILHENLGSAGVEACTVERISLESVFLRITQQHLDNKNRRGPYVLDDGKRFFCF
ncbi:P-loop containing nucleoside triphosphate hydrolase protein [Rhizoctonia solani]|uniref:P-loop containing nucleoside triphosphate hydrolase protein n=1 Tax=Rhizoctonia solani TaxID=456999 RepID=A0A8H7M8H5_9AGAM|nr:P-loop containing nucleoside triphosphate hydrolase protein [Rhizoctonia solani]